MPDLVHAATNAPAYGTKDIRTARSVWSARSLLPLWNGPAASKATASCAHSERFATGRVPPVP